jgi:electron-transferring-flavoprotein dehydrogenase
VVGVCLVERESMDYDVVIIGAGPAGLSAAIKLKQLAHEKNEQISVCILEKGAQVGAHILSGAVLDPRALKELLPDNWQNAPLDTKVTQDAFYFLTAKKAFKLPTPPQMKNHGNYIISLGLLCQYLAQIAEDLGVEIYPGFAATDVLYDDKGNVIGVATGDMGIDKNGEKTSNFQQGMNLYAKQTFFAEGCRGQLSQRLINRFNLRQDAQEQSYGLGIKEVWEIKPDNHNQGQVLHTIGWPLDTKTYGGSFVYHLSNNRVAVGFVVGLDYQNPWLSPFDEMQRFKTHPMIKQILTGGERISYGARALNEGGYQAIPKLTFPGGLLIGDSAGFLDVPKIKGIHNAMKSGMCAATSMFDALSDDAKELAEYPQLIKKSWICTELYKVRNVRPSFRYGLFTGLFYSALETYLFKGKMPWTFGYQADYRHLKEYSQQTKIDYPKADGKLTFDRPSSVYLSNTFHEENQPCHLKLKDPSLAISLNYDNYRSPETRYCPAGVYEIIMTQDKPQLQINGQNCIHCKSCDIKDPGQNIQWQAPEGGGGPNYTGM